MKIIKQQFSEIIKFFKLMVLDKRKHLFIAFFAGLSGMFFNLISANMLKGIFSAVTLESRNLLYKYIWFFILMLAGVFVYNYICWKLYGSSCARITGGIRRVIISKIYSLNLSDIQNNHSAHIMSVLTNDLDAAQGIYVNMRFYITTIIVTFIPTILVFHISNVLALFIILMAILQLIVNLLVIKPLEKHSTKIRENMFTINSTIVDILQNNMSIRLYCSESFYRFNG